MSGIFYDGEWYENARLLGHPCQEPLYERSSNLGVYYCFSCPGRCRCEIQIKPDARCFPRVIVARPFDGITLNTALEYLLDDTGELLIFDGQPEAEVYLLSHGVPEDSFCFLHFIDYYGDPDFLNHREGLPHDQKPSFKEACTMNGNTTPDTFGDDKKAVRVRLAGEIPIYYRTYYVNMETGGFYTLTNFRSVRTWHTTSRNGGEPDIPLKDGLLIEIMNGDRVISRESISHNNDGDAIGLPVFDPSPAPAKPRRGKKAAADTPASGERNANAPGEDFV